jgi:RNA polymerase sigma-70 factor (ECF subfamily)
MAERRDEEDAEDIRRVLAGDRSAYAAIVKRHARRVHDLARRMLRDAHEAEDTAQQAFLNAYKALDRFDLQRPFRNWLLRITSNLCRNRLAARGVRQKERAAQGTDALLPQVPAPAPEPEAPDWTPGVEEAIHRLPEPYRLAIVLRYQHECSLQEIADIAEIPVATVKTHLHRGRAALGKLLQASETGSEASGTEGRA